MPVPDAASNAGAPTSQSSMSWSHTSTGSNLILIVSVHLRQNGSTTVQSITHNSVSLTQVPGAIATNAGNTRSEIWKLANPATGSKTILVTLTAAEESTAGAMTYTGAATEASGGAGSTGNSNSPSVTITSTSSSLAFGGYGQSGGNATSTPDGTERYDLADANLSVAGDDKTGAASVTVNPTSNKSSKWAMVGCSIDPSGTTASEIMSSQYISPSLLRPRPPKMIPSGTMRGKNPVVT